MFYTSISTADSKLSVEARIGTTLTVVIVVLLISTIIIVGVVSITVESKSADVNLKKRVNNDYPDGYHF